MNTSNGNRACPIRTNKAIAHCYAKRPNTMLNDIGTSGRSIPDKCISNACWQRFVHKGRHEATQQSQGHEASELMAASRLLLGMQGLSARNHWTTASLVAHAHCWRRRPGCCWRRSRAARRSSLSRPSPSARIRRLEFSLPKAPKRIDRHYEPPTSSCEGLADLD